MKTLITEILAQHGVEFVTRVAGDSQANMGPVKRQIRASGAPDCRGPEGRAWSEDKKGAASRGSEV
jgi:hypothetical protein